MNETDIAWYYVDCRVKYWTGNECVFIIYVIVYSNSSRT